MRKTAHDYAELIVQTAIKELQGRDSASVQTVACRAPGCERTFVGVVFGEGMVGTGPLSKLRDHAEAVHTFDDIRRILSEYLRERFGKSSTTTSNGTWVWIDDLADDWVVFQVEEGNESTLLKASYAIAANNDVTLGDPVEVVRRTVYDPVKAAE